MKPILAPHKEQDGWVYTRWFRFGTLSKQGSRYGDALEQPPCPSLTYYSDVMDGSRIISSRRVEEAVETADFLRLCAEEGLSAVFHPTEGPDLTHYTKRWDKGWMVFTPGGDGCTAPTLREAYYRYKAASR